MVVAESTNKLFILENENDFLAFDTQLMVLDFKFYLIAYWGIIIPNHLYKIRRTDSATGSIARIFNLSQ